MAAQAKAGQIENNPTPHTNLLDIRLLTALFTWLF